tara:strand:+ start:3201 stop:3551 length:351 start_codon:yes stop_codon:yes gene_type:complete
MDFIDNHTWIPIHTLSHFECCIEYYVNNQGQVKSTKGEIERILKHKPHKSGYPQVNLTQRIGRRKTITVPVHKLVALAFLPPPLTPPGRNKGCSRIIHIDNNKCNCKSTNLKWVIL